MFLRLFLALGTIRSLELFFILAIRLSVTTSLIASTRETTSSSASASSIGPAFSLMPGLCWFGRLAQHLLKVIVIKLELESRRQIGSVTKLLALFLCLNFFKFLEHRLACF